MRWTSRDSRSSSPAAAARAEQRRGRAATGRARERLGADDPAAQRLDQRLVEDLDLLMRDRAFEQRVARWGDGGGDRAIRCPPAPLE